VNVSEAVESMKTGQTVVSDTWHKSNPPFFHKMCHGDIVLSLIKDTACAARVMEIQTAEEFSEANKQNQYRNYE
jgi:hypothetical protein